MVINHHNKVRDWVKKGESDRLEFKVQVSAAYKVARTIAALANTRGGYLVTGITDDGDIVGVVEPEKEMRKLNEAAQLYCVPPVSLSFVQHIEDFLIVLAAKVEESNNKPHRTITKNGSEEVFIRIGNKTMPAAKMVVKVLQNEFKQDGKQEDDSSTRKLDTKELGLLDYLKKRENITLKQFARLVNISERRARRMLVQMTLDGYIRLHTHNKEDFYSLS